MKYFFGTPIGETVCKDFVNKLNNHIEEPDFIFINSDNKKIGFEITNLVIKSRKQEVQSLLDKIVQNVFAMISKTTISKYYILLLCDAEEYSSIHLNKKKLQNRIYNFIMSNNASITKELKVINFLLEDGTPMRLIVSLCDDFNFGGGQSLFASIVHSNPFFELQEIIDKKSKKNINYLKKCDKCNLLIVCDPHWTKGSFVEFTENISQYKFNSNFHNMYLLELGDTVGVKSTLLNAEKF